MTQVGKVIYTARTHTTGGRESGASRSSDGHLDIKLATPGAARIGTNPEQLFAAGWSACFESALALAARRKKVNLPLLLLMSNAKCKAIGSRDTGNRDTLPHEPYTCYQFIRPINLSTDF